MHLRLMPLLSILLTLGLVWGPNHRGEAADLAAPRLMGHWDASKTQDGAMPDLGGAGLPARLLGVTVRNKVEDLVQHPHLYFDGLQSQVIVDHHARLNPQTLTMSAWVLVRPDGAITQKPILVKSLPAHNQPWYQYGLFVMAKGTENLSLSCYLSVAGQAVIAMGDDTVPVDTWGMATATWDGKTARVYWNGRQVASQDGPVGDLDGYDTPLLLGAYANLPRTADYCLGGLIGSARLYDGALSDAQIMGLYESEAATYPAAPKRTVEETPYAKRINDALRADRDVLGEQLIARGGATYDGLKDVLHPLFFSTGDTYQQQGVHNLIFADNGGQPPYIVPLADGSRIATPTYASAHRLEFFVGRNGREAYGSKLDRLDGPHLKGTYYPVLQTAYTDDDGQRWTQESFAGHVPGVPGLVALVRLQLDPKRTPGVRTRLRVRLGDGQRGALRTSGSPTWNRTGKAYLFTNPDDPVYLLWSPQGDLPTTATVNVGVYQTALKARLAYWDSALAQGCVFEVPEPLVMACQRNLLIQNLTMRWRYTLGPVVYHGDFYQPESSDAIDTLGLYGHTDAFRDGLTDLLPKIKGKGYYTNWEYGEKLTHAARYFLLTHDAEFINRHTAEYRRLCQEFAAQMAKDPHGLLEKQVHCGDIAEVAYCPFHLTVCWRGMRDMAQVWALTGHTAESELAKNTAARLRAAVQKALDQSTTWLADGSFYVPSVLLQKQAPFQPITKSRMGSYWNLVMPYAFASGFWEPESRELAGITKYMHEHGGLLLGLLRFNYYPVAIGSSQPKGLPGYATSGFDNVYLPSYQRLLSDRDEADRLVLSFYGKLAHGQTRNTFVNGEGETVGEVPGEKYRSCYGTPSSANNTAFLLPLRLMLVRESFAPETGLPHGLYLADATPREWLKPGQKIVVRQAPTCFGPVSYTLAAASSGRRVTATVEVPSRDLVGALRLKLRLPGKPRLQRVTVNGESHTHFDSDAETIDLTGLTGTLKVVADTAPLR